MIALWKAASHKPRARQMALLALAGVALMLVGQASGAHPPYPTFRPYSVTLEDERGSALRTFSRDGSTFVLGYLGERYRVRLSNDSDRRVEAVLRIDGRDAVSGGVGDFVHERGYIVPPHGTVVVDGFRRSLDETAAFRFSRPSSSYSARMGTPENVGVIGVAFFSEQRPPRPRLPMRPSYYDDDGGRPPWEPRADARRSGSTAARRPRDEAPRAAPSASGAAKRSAPSGGGPGGTGAPERGGRGG